MRRLTSLFIAFILVLSLLPLAPVDAIVLETCADYDGSVGGPFFDTGFVGLGGVDFVVGEQMTFTFFKTDGAAPNLEAWLLVDGETYGPVSVPGALSFHAPEDGTYFIGVEFTGLEKGVGQGFEISCDFVPFPNELGDAGLVIGPPCENLFDGRVNDNQALDCAAPVAIYLGDTLDLYAINPNSGEGALALSIDPSLWEGDAPAENTLLASGVNPFTGKAIRVYRLSTDEILVMTEYHDAKPYQVSWYIDNPELLFHAAA